MLKYKGKFIKKVNLEKAERLAAGIKRKIGPEKRADSVPDQLFHSGQRVVDLQLLGKNLKCSSCSSILSLENILSEKIRGLHSTLLITCTQCPAISTVHTGKVHKTNKPCAKKDDYIEHNDLTTMAVLGTI